MGSITDRASLRLRQVVLDATHVVATAVTATVALAAGAAPKLAASWRTPREVRSRADRPPRLLTFEGDYSLSTIRERQLEHLVTCRDLEGFFDHVWSVHPAAGADPNEPWESSVGPLTTTEISPRHTMVEGRVAFKPWLRYLPKLNFVLGQCALFARLHRLVREEGIDVIRASEPFYLGLFGLALSRWNGVPLVVRLIANYDAGVYGEGQAAYPRLFRRRSVEKRIDRFVLARADLVAAGNEDIRGYALANGAREERTTVFLVGNAIDPVHFELEPSERPSVSDELDIGARPFIVLVSRLVPQKHPEDFLAVLAEARRRMPDLVGVLVGDGSMRGELEARARELGIGKALIFAGERNQQWIARALSSADVVLSPLTGRALVEATLSGTPVVAYDVDWHSELIEPGKTGLLVPFRDTRAMARAVCDLLADEGLASSLAEAARAKTRDLMDPQALIDHERQSYQRLLSGRRAAVARRC
ncbi:MAG: glycosyltransferase family 4 protein [Actinomycetota bacterium]|nr:glycosyltransferase family 4 protein [Actinomycetota bacterium]